MLIATWVVMTGIGLYAVSNGDYRLVLYPLDYDGNICGTGTSVSNATAAPNASRLFRPRPLILVSFAFSFCNALTNTLVQNFNDCICFVKTFKRI